MLFHYFLYADSESDMDFARKSTFGGQTVELGHHFFVLSGSILMLSPYLNKERKLRKNNA
jgi:hypothetical protein